MKTYTKDLVFEIIRNCWSSLIFICKFYTVKNQNVNTSSNSYDVSNLFHVCIGTLKKVDILKE